MKTYFCYTDFYEQGCGAYVAMSLQCAERPSKAFSKHKEHFKINDYIARDGKVFNIKNQNRIIGELTGVFDPVFIEFLKGRIVSGSLFNGFDKFAFEYSLNRS